jgi:predicted nicotinamide N-methyase
MPEIRLHTGAPASGLRRLLERMGGDAPPYWAHAWAGGLILARHLLERPEIVAGRTALDVGCGGGVAGIAAAQAGAARVAAVDVDPAAIEAAQLNAALNGVAVQVERADVTAGPPPAFDLILAGDVFYDPGVAARMLPFLGRCRDAGVDVLIGDPGRSPLPVDGLEVVAEYPTPDFGAGGRMGRGAVYRLRT